MANWMSVGLSLLALLAAPSRHSRERSTHLSRCWEMIWSMVMVVALAVADQFLVHLWQSTSVLTLSEGYGQRSLGLRMCHVCNESKTIHRGLVVSSLTHHLLHQMDTDKGPIDFGSPHIRVAHRHTGVFVSGSRYRHAVRAIFAA